MDYILPEPTWEELIGYPKGVYGSFKEMIYEEYGEDSEQANDLNRTFREARISNDPTYGGWNGLRRMRFGIVSIFLSFFH